MKRKSNLYDTVCSISNLLAADLRARKNKKKQRGVKKHDKRRGCNILTLHNMLCEMSYVTSAYHLSEIFDPKPREISALPYWPDRIAQHAIMIPIEQTFTANFTADTYSCIKGKGVSAAVKAIKRTLKDRANTRYYAKLDVKKFYPSIDHDILKRLIRRLFKDPRLLQVIDEIIDSAPGVPIGNYLSQYFANYYLSGFDHWLKETKRVRYYFRYADDMIIFSSGKAELHQLRVDIQEYLSTRLNLTVKENYQVHRTCDGLDFLGLVFRHEYTRLRKRNKKNLARAVNKGKNRESIAGHMSLVRQCNSRNLIKKLKPYEHIKPNKKL